ncbi:MAG: hypothetical protein RR865_04200, partial [Clostridia bacterium]
SFASKEFVRVVGAHSPYITGAESHFRKSTIPPAGECSSAVFQFRFRKPPLCFHMKTAIQRRSFSSILLPVAAPAW